MDSVSGNTRKLRILMVCEFYDPQLEFQENILVRYYRKYGHEVRVLTSTFTSVFDYYASRYDKSVPASSFSDHGADIHRLPYSYNLLHKVRAYRGVTPLLNEFEPDLIYVHDISPNFGEFTKYMDSHPDCRMIMDYHADYSNSGRDWLSRRILHGVIRKYFLDKARPYISKIFPIVPAGFPFLRDLYKVPDEEMELLPLGADLDLIKRVQATSDPAEVRQKLGIASDELFIITGGKIVPRKKLHLLFEALNDASLEKVKVVVLGEFPSEESEYKHQVQKAMEPVADKVIFAGWQSTEGLVAHMSAADLAVFPATQSIMWQQSIACGLPLLCGLRADQDVHYLNRHDNCVILPAEQIDSASIRGHIARLAADPALRQAMSAGALKTADEILNWDRLMQHTLRYCTE